MALRRTGRSSCISGHHDTWHYGVMDNGAANATMLEVARLTARERRQVAARAAAVLLVRPFARPLFRLHLVCRSELGRAGTALRGARERRFHRRRRRGGAEECRRRAGTDRTGGRCDRRAGRLGVCRQAHVAFVGSVVLGHRHSRDVRRAQRAAAGAGEDAQCARLVVAHAARSAGQDRREEPGARYARLCAHAVAAADRSGAAARFLRACARAAGGTGYAACVTGRALFGGWADRGGDDAARQGGRRRAFRCGADACVARAGAGVLHVRRSVRARSGAAAAGLAGARSAAQAGEDGARHRQRALPRGQCDAGAEPAAHAFARRPRRSTSLSLRGAQRAASSSATLCAPLDGDCFVAPQ